MEYIKNIEIKNFKSIRHQVIDGCKRINVFIGYPNVGKSNILEALSLYSLNGKIEFKDLVRVQEAPTLFFNGLIENSIGITINNKYDVTVGYNRNVLWMTKIKGSKTSPMMLSEYQFENFEYTGGSNSSDDDLEIKKYHFKNGIVRKLANDYSSLSNPLGENLFSILYSNQQLRQEAIDLLKEYNLELLYDTRDQEFTFLKRTGNSIFTIPYELSADTLQRLIFYKAAIVSNKETVLLFEEPEAHMFPPYISKFTAEIMYSDHQNQFFINTHSPFVLNDFMEDLDRDQLAIFAVGYKKETGETVIRKITDTELDEIYQYGIDLFFNLENYLVNEV